MEDDDYIGFDEVSRIVGYSRTHLQRLMTDPKYHHGDPFPEPVRYGNRRLLWRESEVRAWKARQIKPIVP